MFENDQKSSDSQITRSELTITLIIILFFSVTGATYAYFAFSDSYNNTITGTAATVNLTLTVEKIFPTESSDNTGAMVPQLSSSLESALKSGCVDGNTNVVCQVYKISIENIGGTAKQVIDGGISFYANAAMTTDVSSTMPNLKWKTIESADASNPENSVLGTDTDKAANADENETVTSKTLAPGNSYEYYIIVWINENGQAQDTDPGNTFYGKVWFEASNGTGVTSAFQM